MKTSTIAILVMGILALLAAGLSAPVIAAPVAQFTSYPTPTPGPDGRILYMAQANDSAWRIAAIFNIPLEELRELNKWGDNPIIREGDAILLGFAGPALASATPGPSSTPPPSLPTPTTAPGWGILCIALYEDLNGDAVRQGGEPIIPGGAVSVTDGAGKVSRTADTGDTPLYEVDFETEEELYWVLDDWLYLCFRELPEGNYNITVAVPEGYNATTVTTRAQKLAAGDITLLDFGAQVNSVTIAEAPPPEEGGRSPLLGIVGGVFLVAALGLAVFAGRLVKKPLSS